MTRNFIQLLAAIATAGATPAGAVGPECMSDWGKASDVIRAEGLLPVEDLAKLKSSVIQGQIVRATLCKESGTYTYRLLVKDSAGAMKNVVVDAINPAKPAMSNK